MKITAVVTEEETRYVAHRVELGVVNQGERIEEVQTDLDILSP